MKCKNCREDITHGPVPGDRNVIGWYHTGSGSELCGPVDDESDNRVAEPASIHKASPAIPDPGRLGFHCVVCGQRIKKVPGGHGPTWVHSDSGAVAAPNPPDQDSSFTVEIEGEYGINDGAIRLMSGDHEIVMWDSAEWIEDPSLMFVIVNAIRIGFAEGPQAVADRIGQEL